MASPSTPRRPAATTAASPLASSSRTPTTPSTPAFNLTEDLDNLTATPTAYIRSSNTSRPNPSATTPGGGGGGGDDSADEDEAPDYLRLLSSLNPKSKSTSSSSSSTSGIVIPKRGEKDFEPTGFGGQSKLLERSREAMFQAVSGERRVGSRSLVRAVWDAKRGRAKLLDVQGKIFETVGVIHREQVLDEKSRKTVTKATNELLPEEALFLAERGSLQIYEPNSSDAANEKEGARLVPISVQQAFATLMLPQEKNEAQDEPLTREAYLIYAYLKRLGYVVQRSKVVDAVRAAPISASALARKNGAKPDEGVKGEGVIADPQRPIKLVAVWDVLFYVPRRLAQLGGDAAKAVVRWIQWVYRKTIARIISVIAAKVLSSATSHKARSNAGSLGLGLGLKGKEDDGRRFLGEKGNVEWNTYDEVFTSMQIVPSGHDFWLPSTSIKNTTTETMSTVQQTPGTEQRDVKGLKPFYYAYRPATQYRKSHPPPPEFRIVILNARTTPVPSVWEFENVFAQIPIPGSDAELFSSTLSTTTPTTSGSGSVEGKKELTEEEIKERLEYEKALKASNEAKNRAAYGKFSKGKQKFLREKAAARSAAIAEWKQSAAAQAGVLKRIKDTSFGKALIKVLCLDFKLLRVIARFFQHCPPGCFSTNYNNTNRRNNKGKYMNPAGGGGRVGGRGGVGNPFPPLKAGRRTVVVAVVDGSITTLLRFGESEFKKWALFSTLAQPGQQQQQQFQKVDGEKKEDK